MNISSELINVCCLVSYTDLFSNTIKTTHACNITYSYSTVQFDGIILTIDKYGIFIWCGCCVLVVFVQMV